MDESSPPVAESAAPAPSSWRARWNAFRETYAWFLKPWFVAYGLGVFGALILWDEPARVPGWPSWARGVYGFFSGGLIGYLTEKTLFMLALALGLIYQRFQPFWDTLGEFLKILWVFIDGIGEIIAEILAGLIGCLFWIIVLVIVVAFIKSI